MSVYGWPSPNRQLQSAIYDSFLISYHTLTVTSTSIALAAFSLIFAGLTVVSFTLEQCAVSSIPVLVFEPAKLTAYCHWTSSLAWYGLVLTAPATVQSNHPFLLTASLYVNSPLIKMIFAVVATDINYVKWLLMIIWVVKWTCRYWCALLTINRVFNWCIGDLKL